LAPVQVVVASITEAAAPFAEKVKEQLRAQGIRADVDTRNEKINYKVREHSLNKVPYLFVVGMKEAENSTVTIRQLGSDAQETLDLSAAIAKVAADAAMPHLKQKV
jgi:threonyl-tRNA synthetase